MPNAAYCYDFPDFLQRFGPVLVVSLLPGQPWGASVTGLRIDWTFAGFHHKTEPHSGVRRLDLTTESDIEVARGFWNRARQWAADNNKLMPVRLHPEIYSPQ
jgi:hypothetical protein